MKCTSPRAVGFKSDGKTISWSQKTYSKEYATFQLPCGKCIACRLEYARQWAVRCVHEAQMHEETCFITLTYSDEHLLSDKLQYDDFQKFMKRLRRAYPNKTIGMFVTGEYGDKRKRPHWHAIIFGWEPTDKTPKYLNERGDQVYESDTLTRLWGKGIAEFGSVTFESAGYCARYAAKKLAHGKDDSHDYQPISKKSSKHAIGKKWLERFWPDVFNHGQVTLKKKDEIIKCSIPRYYEKWLKQNQPQEWENYVTKRKQSIIDKAMEKNNKELFQERSTNAKRKSLGKLNHQVTKRETQKKILNQKFNQLQKHLKL